MSYTISVTVGEEVTSYQGGQTIMTTPGLMVKNIGLSLEASPPEGVTIIAPNHTTWSVSELENYSCSLQGCLALNGRWEVAFSFPSPTYVEGWSLYFEVEQITPILSFGSVSTIVGDGSVYSGDDTSTHSKSGQSALGPMGGRSWGVLFNSQGELFYTSFDQGFIAKLNQDGTITHLYEEISKPMVMDFDANEDLYIAEFGGTSVVKLTKNSNYSQAERLMEGMLKQPMAARFGRVKGDVLYVVDSSHHRVLAYNITTGDYKVIAGTGKPGDGKLGIKATESELFYPIDLDVNEYDVMVIADGMNNRIKAVNLGESFQYVCGVVTPPQQIVNVCGVGPSCPDAENPMDTCKTDYTGDGGLATKASINWPFDPRFDSRGRLWFIDSDNHRIRLIQSDGYIYTVGGDAPLPQERGFRFIGSQNISIGDGGTALEMDINRAMDLAIVEKDDGVFDLVIGDTDNNVVRLVQNVVLINNGSIEGDAKMRITDLEGGQIISDKLGFESHFQNQGDLPAPGEMIGSFGTMYILTDTDYRQLRAGFKGPSYFVNSYVVEDDIPSQIISLPTIASNFTTTTPGGVDVYGENLNARVDMSGLSDGEYYYFMMPDPYGWYYFSKSKGVPYGIKILIEDGDVEILEKNIPFQIREAYQNGSKSGCSTGCGRWLKWIIIIVIVLVVVWLVVKK